MGISVPTSLFGVLAFMVVAGFIINSIIAETDYTSNAQRMQKGINEDIANINEISINSTQASDWGSSITNTLNLVYYGLNIVFEYIFLPIYMTADLLIEIGLLPADLAVVGVLLMIGILSGVALYIRGIGA